MLHQAGWLWKSENVLEHGVVTEITPLAQDTILVVASEHVDKLQGCYLALQTINYRPMVIAVTASALSDEDSEDWQGIMSFRMRTATPCCCHSRAPVPASLLPNQVFARHSCAGTTKQPRLVPRCGGSTTGFV